MSWSMRLSTTGVGRSEFWAPGVEAAWGIVICQGIGKREVVDGKPRI
jgi:hypothetical protein